MSIAEVEAAVAQVPDTAQDAASDFSPDDAAAEAVIVRVLRGNPNPAEVTALVVALAHVRARRAAQREPARRTAPHRLPTSASWDRPHQVDYQSPSSWMRALRT